MIPNLQDRIREFIESDFVLHRQYVGGAGRIALLDSGLVDSTGILEVVLFLEEAFEISVQDEEVLPENFDLDRAPGNSTSSGNWRRRTRAVS